MTMQDYYDAVDFEMCDGDENGFQGNSQLTLELRLVSNDCVNEERVLEMKNILMNRIGHTNPAKVASEITRTIGGKCKCFEQCPKITNDRIHLLWQYQIGERSGFYLWTGVIKKDFD